MYLELLVPALATGAIYTLMAVSFNIIYAPSHVLNFGQGDLFAFGGLLGAAIYVNGSVPLLAAVLVVIAVTGLMGLPTYFLGARRFINSDNTFGWLLGTLAIAVGLRNVATLLWDTEPIAFPPFAGLERSPIDLGPFPITPSQIVVVGATAVLVATVELVLRKTRVGWGLRAVAQDREAAALRGLPVGVLTAGAFVAGAALAGLAGLLAAPITQAWAYLGFGLLLKGFTAMVVGGVGNNVGAAIGGVGLAAVEVYGTVWLPVGYRDTLALAVLLIVLMLRPQGIFGHHTARAV